MHRDNKLCMCRNVSYTRRRHRLCGCRRLYRAPIILYYKYSSRERQYSDMKPYTTWYRAWVLVPSCCGGRTVPPPIPATESPLQCTRFQELTTDPTILHWNLYYLHIELFRTNQLQIIVMSLKCSVMVPIYNIIHVRAS